MSELSGTVVASFGKEYQVRTDDGREFRCVLRGKLRLADKTAVNPVAVGDVVAFRHLKDEAGTISAVAERATRLSRRAPAPYQHLEHVLVANLDRLVVVVACARPPYKTRTVDRYLVSAEAGGLDGVICFNKTDLTDDRDAVMRDAQVYRDAGYATALTSAVTREGIDELAALLGGHKSVFAGPSGVGKSSLLNAIDPSLSLRVGDISDATSKGRHTTSSVQLLPIPGGGYVADTPGMRELGLFAVTRKTLPLCFPEFREPSRECKFRDCAHAAEPECGVKAALEGGDIADARYHSYLRLRESLPE